MFKSTIRYGKWALAALVIAVLAMTWGHGGAAGTQAADENAKTQMDIVINNGQCDSSVDSKCTLLLDSVFTVSIVPSTIPVGGYVAWQTLLDYGTLLYKPAASLSNEIKWDQSLLPVRAPASPTGKEGTVTHADQSGIIPPFPVSTQKTSFVNLTFNCARNAGGAFSELIRLVNFNESPSGARYFESDGFTFNVPNVSGLQINCVEQKPEMSLAAHGPDVTCDGQPSTSKGAVPKPAKCDVPVGGQFTLSIDVNTAPAGGYSGFQTWIKYGANLTYKKAPVISDEIVWPDSNIEIRQQGAGSVTHGTLTGIIPPLPVSNFLGNIVELVFNCPTKSSNDIDLIELNGPVAGLSGSAFIDPAGDTIVTNVDSLGINCVNPKTEMSLSAHGPGVTCDGAPSTSKGSVPKPAKCDVPVGGQFTLSIDANAAPAAGYTGFQTWINYGANLTYKKAPLIDEIVWPDNALEVRAQGPGSVTHGALTGVVPPFPVSNFLGNIVELVFNCPTKSSNDIELLELGHPKAGASGSVFFEAVTADEIVPNVDSLGINCVNPPPPCNQGSNNDFELGIVDSNAIPCWTVVSQAGSIQGSWCTQAGVVKPAGECLSDIGAPVPAPPQGTQAAMASQNGRGSHVLYRCNVLAARSVSFQLYLNNFDGAFVSPATLDFTAFPNQQFRADLVTKAGMEADPFTVAAGDILLNIYQTDPGDPLVSGYTPIAADISAFVSQNVCLRFSVVMSEFFLNVGIDDVQFELKKKKPGDTDGDGCADVHENGPDETLGGQRDYKNPHDFYDVAGSPGPPQNGAPDGVVDLPNDILGVIQHHPAGTLGYDVQFDRGPWTGPNSWNDTQGPDGVIDLPNDILGVILQFNHRCQ